VIASLILAALVGFCAQPADAGLIRPYAKLGYVLSTPSAEDLGFVLVDGGSLDDALDKSSVNYGLGLQLVFPLQNTWIEKTETRLGLDMGFQKIFAYEFQASDASSLWTGDEYDFYILGVAEFALADSPFFFQGGLGLHFVLWQEDQEFEGTYSYSYDAESGTSTQFGIAFAGGMNLQAGEKMKVPIVVQLDNIFVHDYMPTLSVMAGLTIPY
jgi:hypothetical protein